MPVWLLFLLTGGVTGRLGTALAVAVDFFKRRQKGKHELALRKVDLDITHAESESAERVEAIEAESKAWHGLMASYRNAIARWSRGDSTWFAASPGPGDAPPISNLLSLRGETSHKYMAVCR